MLERSRTRRGFDCARETRGNVAALFESHERPGCAPRPKLSQDASVRHSIQGQGLARALKVDGGLATLDSAEDGVIQIRVREETRLHN
jgi:hypothetical protein